MNTNGNGTNGNRNGLTRLFHLADGTMLALPADAHYSILAFGEAPTPTTIAPPARKVRRPGLRNWSAASLTRVADAMASEGVPAAARMFGLSKQTLWTYAKRHGLPILPLRRARVPA